MASLTISYRYDRRDVGTLILDNAILDLSMAHAYPLRSIISSRLFWSVVVKYKMHVGWFAK